MTGETALMGCGHFANAIQTRGTETFPVCAICLGIDDGAAVVAPAPEFPITFTCTYCRCPITVTGAQDMGSVAFASMDTRTYYCGCRRWD